MIFFSLLLVAAVVAVRTILMRRRSGALVANSVAAAVALAFVTGSLVFPVPPAPATALAAASPTSPEPSPDAVVAAPSGEAVVPSGAKNVSVACHGSAGMHGADAVGSFDSFGTNAGASDPLPSGSHVSSSKRYFIDGWGVDRKKTVVAEAACLYVDGRPASRSVAYYGVSRPDVATAYATSNFTNSGFEIVVPPKSLSAGRHILQVGIKSRDGQFSPLARKFEIVVD